MMPDHVRGSQTERESKRAALVSFSIVGTFNCVDKGVFKTLVIGGQSSWACVAKVPQL